MRQTSYTLLLIACSKASRQVTIAELLCAGICMHVHGRCDASECCPLHLCCLRLPTQRHARPQGEADDPIEQFIQGWDATRDYLLHSNFLHPLERRTPALYYRCRL